MKPCKPAWLDGRLWAAVVLALGVLAETERNPEWQHNLNRAAHVIGAVAALYGVSQPLPQLRRRKKDEDP